MRAQICIAAVLAVLFVTLPAASSSGENASLPVGPTTWEGNMTFEHSVYIPPGGIVYVMPGTRLLFAPGVNITCDGSMKVIGTSASPVYFGPLSESWQGILFRPGSTSAVSFDNATVEGADINLGIIGRKAYVNNTRLAGGTRPQLAGLLGGLYVVKNLTVEGGMGTGIGLDNCTLRAFGLEVSGNSYAGIYLVSSSAYIKGLVVSNNSMDGIRVVNSTVRLEDGLLDSNIGRGIHSIASYFQCRNVTVRHSTVMGFAASFSDVRLDNSSLSNNGYSGISAQASVITANFTTLSGNGAYGGEFVHIDLLNDPLYPFMYRAMRTETAGDDRPVVGPSNVILRDVDVMGNHLGGVYALGSTVKVENATFSGPGWGLASDGWSALTLKGVHIFNTLSLYSYGGNATLVGCALEGSMIAKSSRISARDTPLVEAYIEKSTLDAKSCSAIVLNITYRSAVMLTQCSISEISNSGRVVLVDCNATVYNAGDIEVSGGNVAVRKVEGSPSTDYWPDYNIMGIVLLLVGVIAAAVGIKEKMG